MGETGRILRGFLMQIFTSFETRDYPEMRPSCLIENEPEFMASLLGRANPGNEHHLIEPGPNSNWYRKRDSEILAWRESPRAAVSVSVGGGHEVVTRRVKFYRRLTLWGTMGQQRVLFYICFRALRTFISPTTNSTHTPSPTLTIKKTWADCRHSAYPTISLYEIMN
jgi:hypothetical protein